MKIYLAGPLFTMAEQSFNVRLKKYLESCDHSVWLPQEKVENLKGQTAVAFFRRNVEGIDWADVVVACMDGPDPDSGTCWECGYAFNKKPVIVYRTDFRVAQDDGLAPYNLMLTESATLQINRPFEEEQAVFQWIVLGIDKVLRRENVLTVCELPR